MDKLEHGDLAARHLATEQRVGAIEVTVDRLSARVDSGFEKLGNSINALGNSFNSASKTDWKTLIGLAGFCLAAIASIGTMAKQPIDAALIVHSTELAQLKTEVQEGAKSFMTKDDYRYERDRGYGQLVEMNRAQDHRLDEITAKVEANHVEALKASK